MKKKTNLKRKKIQTSSNVVKGNKLILKDESLSKRGVSHTLELSYSQNMNLKKKRQSM
jgi:hypothetical protein